MGYLLQKGQTLKLSTGADCQIVQFLGAGSQGEVYHVKAGTQEYALKWYFEHQATPEQKSGIELLVKSGSPGKQFLWPIVMTHDASDSRSFGYLMTLRPNEYRSMFDLMSRKAEPTFLALVTACYELVDAYQKLHAQGLCYRDISFGNVFFHEKTGDVLVCDNDNVTPNGSASTGVLGTPRFMAPEIVRAQASPSADSDLFSLSVLLFYMLMLHHPLEGQLEANIRCLDRPAMNRLYGTDPVFIFDPSDNRNYPVKGYQVNALIYWPLYPEFIKKIFVRAFTQGLQPNGRVRESEWKRVLIQLRDSIFECPHCKSENFIDFDKPKEQSTCWSCNRPFPAVMSLKLDRQSIVLTPNTKLYPHHLDNKRTYDLSEVWATVAQHPSDPTIWGLKNHSPFGWQSTPLNATTQAVDIQKSVRLAAGTQIQFGSLVGKIIL